jgi:hypothetical protein
MVQYLNGDDELLDDGLSDFSSDDGVWDCPPEDGLSDVDLDDSKGLYFFPYCMLLTLIL